jgi:hypothetical protein
MKVTRKHFCLIKHCTMKTCGGVDAQLHEATKPLHYRRKRIQYPLNTKQTGVQNWF